LGHFLSREAAPPSPCFKKTGQSMQKIVLCCGCF